MQLVDGRLTLTPTDLNAWVECEHLTTLALEVATGQRTKPYLAKDHVDLLRRKGEEHEAAYLAKLKAEGKQVVDVRNPANPWDFETAARATEQAMRDGVDVIYQATFVDQRWRGRADFLERVPGQTKLGAWGYEALDTKLARAEKPTYVLQLCFYSDGIAKVQGASPERMHVLLGIGERRTLRHEDFAAYYRRVRAGFEAAITGRRATEPYPVDHCGLCDYRAVCAEWFNTRDHLSLVANIRRDQATTLTAAGIDTLTRLADAPTPVEDLAAHTWETLRDQAHLQRIQRTTGKLDWHLLLEEPGCGFALLPRPSDGDVVFDIEGDPFWEPARGLHFLFGLLTREGYAARWCHTREHERKQFEALIDWFHARLQRHPDMHVYHYGAYEPTALKQLMSVYATREDEMDALLRREVFVNLHTVVRQGLRAGVPSYSLKAVEALPAFARAAEVQSGTSAVVEYEQWMAEGDAAKLEAIRVYNEEDCRATLALRDWLVAHRPPDTVWFELPARTDPRDEAHAEREALRAALVEGAAEGSKRWLAGELMEYHRREARPAWWWFYERLQMTVDDLVDDAESIGRLTPVGSPRAEKRSLLYRMRFPGQQHKLGPGNAIDPATEKSAGTIVEIDDAAGELVLRRGPSFEGTPLPQALIPGKPIGTTDQREALHRLALSIRDGAGRYRACEDVLARARPRFTGGERATIQTMDLAQQRDLAALLDGSYLFVQGPPGTGKTWTGARLVVDLMRRGRRVGVAATSHKAIHNLLDEIEKVARQEALAFRGLKKSSASNDESVYEGAWVSSADDRRAFQAAPPDVLLFAGTAWLFADEDIGVDTLVIDEAGQVSLADALAMGTSARNLILLGDPQQLAHVSQGMHPPGTGRSVLEHLLGDEQATVRPDMGVLLERTQRMHPDVCGFVSEVIYESRLTSTEATTRQSTAFGTGLRWAPVEHVGNQGSSAEEAAWVALQIRRMLGGAWTDDKGASGRLRPEHFMVVAPYNAQVRRLRAALTAAGLGNVPVGTVDKFQGRQAPVVFYSMATSSAADVPRGLDFLFSRNRLNVAVSRAQCLAHVVASPRLLESPARTVEQMRLVNALCRLVEMAAQDHR